MTTTETLTTICAAPDNSKAKYEEFQIDLRGQTGAGADVNARRPNGESLLYVARWREHAEIERILVDAGAQE